MDLWIRSQDRKTIAKCENLYIQEYTDRVAICYGLLTYGTYKSVDRAIQILDEIQIIVKWCQKNMKDVTIGDCNKLIGSFDDYVYEMPKE